MSSFHPVALTAQQQVLEVDMDLLREVLACLGTDVAECHAALLVSHFWCVALERYVCVCGVRVLGVGVGVGCGYGLLAWSVFPALMYVFSSSQNPP